MENRQREAAVWFGECVRQVMSTPAQNLMIRQSQPQSTLSKTKPPNARQRAGEVYAALLDLAGLKHAK
jgi:hypothetical protein